jgi:hypothetical protein
MVVHWSGNQGIRGSLELLLHGCMEAVSGPFCAEPQHQANLNPKHNMQIVVFYEHTTCNWTCVGHVRVPAHAPLLSVCMLCERHHLFRFCSGAHICCVASCLVVGSAQNGPDIASHMVALSSDRMPLRKLILGKFPSGKHCKVLAGLSGSSG